MFLNIVFTAWATYCKGNLFSFSSLLKANLRRESNAGKRQQQIDGIRLDKQAVSTLEQIELNLRKFKRMSLLLAKSL